MYRIGFKKKKRLNNKNIYLIFNFIHNLSKLLDQNRYGIN